VKRSILVLPLLALCACATPVTMLRSPQNGSIVRCGGDSSGSVAGGVIGYKLQSNDAAKCVKDYSALGYQVISQAK